MAAQARVSVPRRAHVMRQCACMQGKPVSANRGMHVRLLPCTKYVRFECVPVLAFTLLRHAAAWASEVRQACENLALQATSARNFPTREKRATLEAFASHIMVVRTLGVRQAAVAAGHAVHGGGAHRLPRSVEFWVSNTRLGSFSCRQRRNGRSGSRSCRRWCRGGCGLVSQSLGAKSAGAFRRWAHRLCMGQRR